MNENEYNAKIGARIKEARKAKKITLKELGQSVGISESTTKRYEDGQIKGVDVNIIKKFAAALDVTPAWLMGYDDVVPLPEKKYVKIPVVGKIVAGTPTDAVENIISYEEIPAALARRGEFFGLEIYGDSMEPTMFEGDVVIVLATPVAETGDIAVVLVNGDEATIKEIQRAPDGVTLIGHNLNAYKPHFYSNEQIETLPVLIRGVVCEIRRKLKTFPTRY